MNIIKKQLIYFLIKAYGKNFDFHTIRMLIKRLLKNERIIIEYLGVKLYVSKYSAIENSVLFNEYNEKQILKLIRCFSELNYNFIDVGANIGIHSLIASHANENIEIFSFEPEPQNFFNFISNITLNKKKNIRPFCLGIGNLQENKNLNINSGWNKGKHSLKVSFGESENKIKIPIVTLDNFSNLFSLKYTIMKIDVEGFEKEVVLGAQETLNSITNGIVIIELLESNNGNETCNQIMNLLVQYGFNKLFKLFNETKFVEVVDFQEDSDYFLIKGEEALESFLNFKNK